jgi:hypothetical protein
MAKLTEDQKVLLKNVATAMRVVMKNNMHIHQISFETDKSIRFDVREYPAGQNLWDGTTAP